MDLYTLGKNTHTNEMNFTTYSTVQKWQQKCLIRGLEAKKILQ